MDILTEDRYFDKWAKEQAAKNRAKNATEKEAARAQKKLDRQFNKTAKPKKPTDWELWELAQDAVGRSFPDGDPIDHLQRDIDMEAIDKAVKKYAGPYSKGKAKYGLYDWVKDMWADSQKDALYDAELALKRKDVRLFDNSPFYNVEGGPSFRDDLWTWDKVKIIPISNPW